MSIPSDFFSLGGKFQPEKLARHIVSDTDHSKLVTPITEKGGGTIWHYKWQEGIWRPDGISHIEQEVERILGSHLKPYMINQVVQLVQVKTYLDRRVFVCPPHLIVMENGTFNLKTKSLEEHSWTNYAKAKMPVLFNPNANCPEIDRFFHEIHPENPKVLYEIIGYCLWKSMPIHVFVILLGGGRNGKGTFINLIKAFLGSDNVSSVSLQELDTNRFATAQLYGKLANLNNDVPSNPLKYTGKLKQLTSGDRITAEKKNQQMFQFENHAKLIFSCNELPPTYDNTMAFFRRQIVLKFEQEFIDGINADQKKMEKITTSQELSGLFNRAIEALYELLERQTFSGVKSVEERAIEYILKSNPAQYFLQNFVYNSENPVEYITKTDLYSAYVKWCHKNGYRPKASNWFSTQAKMWLPFIDEGTARINGKKAKAWYGIRLKWNVGYGGNDGIGVSTLESENSILENIGRKWRSIVTTVPNQPLLDDFNTLADESEASPVKTESH